jgi:hypothetical protein
MLVDQDRSLIATLNLQFLLEIQALGIQGAVNQACANSSIVNSRQPNPAIVTLMRDR